MMIVVVTFTHPAPSDVSGNKNDFVLPSLRCTGHSNILIHKYGVPFAALLKTPVRHDHNDVYVGSTWIGVINKVPFVRMA